MTLTARPSARNSWLLLVPMALLLIAAVLANAGISLIPNARAATDSVVVTATVGSDLSVADQCAVSGTMAITVALGTHADGTCAINFGSTNDSSVTLQAGSSAGVFFATGFADEGGTCANLSAVDEAGLKVVSVGANVTKAAAWTCALGAAGNNATTSYMGVPDAYTNVCQTSVVGTALTCTLGIGVFEAGSNLAPGNYAGTLNLNVLA